MYVCICTTQLQQWVYLRVFLIVPKPCAILIFQVKVKRPYTDDDCNGADPPLADIVIFGLSLSGFLS